MKMKLTVLTVFYVILTSTAFMAVSQASYGAEATGLAGAFKHRMNHLIERQGVVSSNIANATTPGYLSRDIKFVPKKSMRLVPVARTSGKHMMLKTGSRTGELVMDKRNIRHDGNSVKLDEQMLKLSEVQMNYRLMTNLKSKLGAMQRLAVVGNR